MLFCVDTSALVEAWNTWYPPDVFPALWEELGSESGPAELVSPVIVLDELRRKEDEILKWARDYVTFLELDAEVQLKQAEIVNRFPKLTEFKRGRSLADPWVVALAAIKRCPVVSMEKPGSTNNPRIPDVCSALKIEHLAFVEMLRRIRWECQATA